jgi:DMSO/TMAO reductase YedYZ molybdopterin-dependent catalytic subunit
LTSSSNLKDAPNTWTEFGRAAVAGFVSLGFLLILRIASVAPFPPESALEAFLRVIPESIEEPSVQAVGGLAGELGVAVATIIAACVYGVFGIIFAKIYAPRMTTRSLSTYEKFLVFSLVPWLFFGLIVLPATGTSIFGISSGFGSAAQNLWVFPLASLVANLVFGVVLAWEYGSSAKALFAPRTTSIPVAAQVRPMSETRAVSRRSFIEKGAIALASLAFLVTGIDSLLSSASVQSSQGTSPSGSSVNLGNAPQIFDDSRLSALVNSEITANSNFYQVDIDIFAPAVNGNTWSLDAGGLVANPKTYSLADLQSLPKTIEYNTFECVSNVVNGNLISNAEWGGVRLSDLFSDMGGVQQGTEYIVFYSVDGYSVGVPVSRAMMKDAMVAYEMNNAPLPQNHGYPLRAVIPGLYGMMSAKWISKIQAVSQDYIGYWQSRGWSDTGVVQTLAFILVPGSGNDVSLSQNGGSVMLGGYAYAGDRGISKVEVSTDGGKTWQNATLKPPIANNTWTLWAYEWITNTTGSFPVYARATDGTGALQSSASTNTFPNGATGYAMILVDVVK